MSESVKLGRKSAYTARPEDLTIIGFDTPHKKGEHPLWDKRANDPVDESMVRNIMQLGVIETVTVTRDGEMIVVADGRGRTKSAREANKRLEAMGSKPVRIPVMFRTGNDARLVGVMVSANEIRRADDLLVKAEKAQQMLDYGADMDEVCTAFGVSEGTIESWLRITSSTDEVKNAIRAGQISATAAATLAQLSRDDQNAKLKELLEAGTTTVKDAEAVVKGKKPKNGNGKKATPGKPLLRKVLNSPALTTHCSPEAICMLAWVLGEGSPKKVKGLSKALRSIGAEDLLSE